MNKIDRRRKGVLIVECDSAKLASQHLAIGNDLQNLVRLAFPQNPINLVQSSVEEDLLEKLGEIHKKGRPYRDIVIIGHSNQNGLRISSDRFDKWDVVANWFKPFEPHRIFLIACNAGRWLPCASLFNGIPTLKEIFGSPVPANKKQVYFILSILLHRLRAQSVDERFIRMMQGINFFALQGLMFNRTRREYEQGSLVEGAFWTVTEPIIHQIINRLRG